MEPRSPSKELSTRDGYDRWASFYDEYPNPLIALETPEVRRLVGNVVGRKVLDLGCGTGRHSGWLAEAGAQVTALDFSSGMLAEARKKIPAQNVEFVHHDLNQSLPFEDAHFDHLIHCLALDHLDAPQAMLHEMRRVLRPGGRAVLSMMHPAMFLKGTQARFVDPGSGELISIENNRFSISEYVLFARDAGLRIEHMAEHSCTAEIAVRIPRAEKYVGWPTLLILVLEVPAGSL